MRSRFHLLCLVLPLLIAFVIGCGGGASSNSGSKTVTETLAASPTSIQAGQSATLTWSTTNAASVSIDNGIGTLVCVCGSVRSIPASQ